MVRTVVMRYDRCALRIFRLLTCLSAVAVTGLPDPQEEHAMIMCRFARDCRIKFKEVTQRLELSLGPDTFDLAMRFGIHSGTLVFFYARGFVSHISIW